MNKQKQLNTILNSIIDISENKSALIGRLLTPNELAAVKGGDGHAMSGKYTQTSGQYDQSSGSHTQTGGGGHTKSPSPQTPPPGSIS